jgi:hypothetical protein
MPPPPQAAIVQTIDTPTLQPNPNGAPVSVRYSEFLKLVNGDKIEKVTFSADGSQLLGVDVEGTRVPDFKSPKLIPISWLNSPNTRLM